MRQIVNALQTWDFRLCGVFLVDAQFLTDTTKFFSGILAALSAMVQLEVPHINVLSKLDLLDKTSKKNLDRWLTGLKPLQQCLCYDGTCTVLLHSTATNGPPLSMLCTWMSLTCTCTAVYFSSVCSVQVFGSWPHGPIYWPQWQHASEVQELEPCHCISCECSEPMLWHLCLA